MRGTKIQQVRARTERGFIEAPPPGGTYEPPVPPRVLPQAAPDINEKYELSTQSYIVPVNIGPQETVVYTTSRPWKACDVYLVPVIGSVTPVTGVLSVFVYALNQGSRALVASGRFCFAGIGTESLGVAAPTITTPMWIAAARAVAGAYEVTARWDQINALGAQGNPQIHLTTIASNEAVEPPPDVGSDLYSAILMVGGADSRLGQLTIGTTRPPRIEVLRVSAVNGAAAARYLMMFDIQGDPQGGGLQRPLMVWPMGSLAGEGISVPFRYRQRQQPDGLLSFWASSTPQTFTAALDCSIQVVAR